MNTGLKTLFKACRACVKARMSPRTHLSTPFYGPSKDNRIIASDLPWKPSEDSYQPVKQGFGSTQTTVLVSETRLGWFIKPTQPHYKYQFEDYFGFGHCNTGYTGTRVIFAPRS